MVFSRHCPPSLSIKYLYDDCVFLYLSHVAFRLLNERHHVPRGNSIHTHMPRHTKMASYHYQYFCTYNPPACTHTLALSLAHSLSYPLTHQLTHRSMPLTHPPTHSFIPSPTHPPTHSQTHSIHKATHPPTHLDAQPPTHSFIPSPTYLLTHSLYPSTTRSSSSSLAHSFPHSPPHSFTHSFTNSHKQAAAWPCRPLLPSSSAGSWNRGRVERGVGWRG